MRKAAKRIFIVFLLTALSLCAPAQAESPYDGSLADAQVLIRIPALRQYGGYTCGTTCVQMLMNWLFPYEGDLNLAAYEEALGTTEDAGTPPESIVRFLAESGVAACEKENKTVDELAAALDAGRPTLMCIQAWSSAEDGSYNTADPSDPETYLAEGHWVICVGYQQTENGRRFFFNDPACVGHCLLDEAELNARWIDMDGAGRVYDHYGIEISGASAYDPDGAFHLD